MTDSPSEPKTAQWHGHGDLPLRLRTLFISGRRRTAGWIAEALAADRACQITLVERQGAAEGLALLREEAFDVLLLGHEPPELDALEILACLKASGQERPATVVLGAASEAQLAADCYEAGADAYACLSSTTTRALLWRLARAAERRRLEAENIRLDRGRRQRCELEHQEASRLLADQRALLDSIDNDSADDPARARRPTAALPPQLIVHYRELLRTYVIMGSGRLQGEIDRLAGVLAAAGVSPRQAVAMHLDVVEDLLADLGSRGARHVLNRADLLVLELSVRLAEAYRQQARNRPTAKEPAEPGWLL